MLFFVQNGLLLTSPTAFVPHYSIGQLVYTFEHIEDNLQFIKREQKAIKLCYSL